MDTLPAPHQCRDALARIDGREGELIDTLIAWSAVNSGSRNSEGIAVMDGLVRTHAGDLGAELTAVSLRDTETVNALGQVERVPNAPALSIAKRSGANRRVLLTGHLDTVFPKEDSFQSARWTGDGILNGPGVADMKGGILVMLEALRAFEESPLAGRLDWEVILSPDEETGSLASAPLLADRAKTADIGLTYEPALADGTLAGARKGSGNYTLVVEGRSAHAGREFHSGRNAVVHLSRIVADLAALTGARDGLTVNPAVIHGGSAPNVVPDLAWCRFNVRLEQSDDAGWLAATLSDLVRRHEQEDGFHVRLHGGVNRPPKPLSQANRLLMDRVRDCGAALGIGIDYKPTGGCCEGNNLAAAGLPNVDTLGVRGGKIHSHDEFMIAASLTERARLSALILMAIAAGRFDDVLQERRTDSAA